MFDNPTLLIFLFFCLTFLSPCANIYFAVARRHAGMAELADAHDSGSCVRTYLQVQVLFPAPPNNPNLDTRLGLLLFVHKARKLGHSAFVPATPCPTGSYFKWVILRFCGLWGSGERFSRHPMALPRYPIGLSRYPIEKGRSCRPKKITVRNHSVLTVILFSPRKVNVTEPFSETTA